MTATGDAARDEGLQVDDLVDDRALEKDAADRLGHTAIAQQVAHLIAAAQPPLTVGLFGAWGSGKSSFYELLRRRIEPDAREDDDRIVRYDAWAFSGESLQRNFISTLASSLGFPDDGKNDKFHTALYESTSRVKFDGAAVVRMLPINWALKAVLAVLLAVLLVEIVTIALGHSELFLALVGYGMLALFGGGALALVGALARSILALGKFDVEQAPPSPELFRRTFGDLVHKALGLDCKTASDRHPVASRRLVVFIDELDRCRPKDMVEILASVRTFFDVPHTVFVVAADRAVVEDALSTELPKLPARVEEPYYSTAGAFLDKIFQHQIALPPLRRQALTRLAQTLVASRKHGLWADLQDGQDPTLGEVLLPLVPSHVVSPRRVKVLMNNFATLARVAEARGLAWRARATEIAKFTVLKTEFPFVAEDLQRDRRLLRELIKRYDSSKPGGPGDYQAPDGRLGELLKDYVDLPSLAATEPDAVVLAPDVTLVRRADAKKIGAALLEQLYAYLSRTRDVPDPQLSLIYLESAAVPNDLQSPELGDLIESKTVDDPEAVATAIGNADGAERQNAVRFVASLLAGSDLIDEERDKAVQTLLESALTLDQVAPETELAVSGALGDYLRDRQLPDELLPDALDLVSRFSRQPAFIRTLAGDARLVATPQVASRVAAFADRLEPALREPIWAAVAQHLPSGGINTLIEPAIHLPTDAATELMRRPDIAVGLRGLLVALATADAIQGELSKLIEGVRERVERSQGLEVEMLERLIGTEDETAILVAAREIGGTAALGESRELVGLVLHGLMLDELGRWSLWTAVLPKALPASERGDDGTQALAAISSMLSRVSEPGEFDPLAANLPLVIPLANAADAEKVASALLPAIEEAASEISADKSNVRTLTEAILGLRSLAASPDDIEAPIAARIAAIVTAEPISEPNMTLVRALSDLFGMPALEKIGAAVSAVAPPPPRPGRGPVDPAPLRRLQLLALMELARDGRRISGSAPSSVAVPIDEVRDLVVSSDGEAADAWFRSHPGFEEGYEVLPFMPADILAATSASVLEWTARLSNGERTDLLKRWIGEKADRSSWVEQLAEQGIDEAEFVTAIGQRLERASTSDVRDTLARNIAAARPSKADAQRAIADLVIGRLRSPHQADAETARRLFPALGARHGSEKRLATAVRDAIAAGRLKLRDKDRDALKAAGVTLPARRFLGLGKRDR